MKFYYFFLILQRTKRTCQYVAPQIMAKEMHFDTSFVYDKLMRLVNDVTERIKSRLKMSVKYTLCDILSKRQHVKM